MDSSTVDRRVQVAFVVGADEPATYPTERVGDPQDWAAKLATAAALGREVTARALDAAGHGRRTFALERDAAGEVVVHFVRMPQTGAALRAMTDQESWRAVLAETARRFPDGAKVWAVGGFVRYDPVTGTTPGHYALGGGGLAVMSANSLSTWPSGPADVPAAFADATRVAGTGWRDDSLGRGTYWANASTGIGAWLHELGHCLSLDHPRPREPLALMNRGFDHFARWFTTVDAPHEASPAPTPFSPAERPTWGSQSARLAAHPWITPAEG